MSMDPKESARELEVIAVSNHSRLEQVWLEEAEYRWREIESGKINAIPEAEVMQAAKKALKKCG